MNQFKPRLHDVITVLVLLALCVTYAGSEVVARSGVPDEPGSNVEPAECDLQILTEGVEVTPTLEHYGIGVNVTYSCTNDSWALIGAVTSECGANSTWSEEPPFCTEITCDVEIPENGDVIGINGSAVTYRCHRGFELVGQESHVCHVNSTWNHAPPTCHRTCSDPYRPEHGYAKTNCTYEDCTATFSCKDGYMLYGDTMSTCKSNAWKHTEALPNCTEIMCDSPPEVEHSHTTFDPAVGDDVTKYSYKTVVLYLCDDNYTVVGEDEMYCTENSEWQGQPPTCVAVAVNDTEENDTKDKQCPSANLTHGTTQRNGDTVTYDCFYGYRLVGPSTRICMENGTWSGDEPDCVLEKFCADPEIINHANMSVEPAPAAEDHQYGFNTRVTYVCVQNVSMTSLMTCDEQGKWTETELHCKDPRIDDLPDLSGDGWRQVFLSNGHWTGRYRYWDKYYKFQMFALTQQNTNTNQLILLFDDYEAKLYVSVSYSDRDNTFTFHETRLLTHSERFPSGRPWFFSGHMTKQDNQWTFYSSQFSTDKFSHLQMSPNHDHARIPNISELDEKNTQKNATALALGIVIAMLLVLLAAALAAYFVKQHVFKSGGHRAITSFENPVYDCENALKDTDVTEPQDAWQRVD